MRPIDADKVKAESREHCKTCIINGTKHCKTCVVNLICERMDLQPTVEPQRPQGKWINHRTITHDGEFYCSNCDECAEWVDGGSQLLSNFCSNCGAEMKGGAE